ncbi:MAG TPA: OmpA family protein [Acetobacteraceae bacterium]|nr:OmpA family protein [Acetobacteraceae bacterium]
MTRRFSLTTCLQALRGPALAALLLAPTVSPAQTRGPGEQSPLLREPVSGPYIGLGAGLNLSQRSSLSLDPALAGGLGAFGVGPAGSVVFQPGVATLLSLGWGFGNGLRAEIEASWRSEAVDRIDGFGGAGRFGSVGGRRDTYGLMGNVLLDLGTFGPVVPYIGVGAGWMISEWRNVRGTAATSGLRLVLDDDDGRFAYQGIAGFAFPLDFLPGLAVSAEYRFLGMVQPRLQARVEGAATGGTLAAGRVEAETYQHSLMLGLRYAFGQAARPAPPSVAAPSPSRSFLVFFDFDRAELTERARQILGEAAQAARTQETTRIEVAGHADRSGTPQYNQALSQRRAEAVAAELVRRGVSRAAITVTAFGESRPLVPTADGVREPQNRRVEIVLR